MLVHMARKSSRVCLSISSHINVLLTGHVLFAVTTLLAATTICVASANSNLLGSRAPASNIIASRSHQTTLTPVILAQTATCCFHAVHTLMSHCSRTLLPQTRHVLFSWPVAGCDTPPLLFHACRFTSSDVMGRCHARSCPPCACAVVSWAEAPAQSTRPSTSFPRMAGICLHSAT